MHHGKPNNSVVSEVAFLFGLGVLLPMAVILSLIFARFRLPTVLAYLLAGMIFGPYGAGLVTEVETLNLFAILGIVFLMFFIGLELDPNDLKRLGAKIFTLTVVEVWITFAVGAGLGLILGLSWVTSVFVGSITAITSTAVVGKLLIDRGRLRSDMGHIIMGIMVVEDFVAVLLILILPQIALFGQVELVSVLSLLTKGILLLTLIVVFSVTLAPKLINYISQFEVQFSEISLLSALSLGIFFSYLSVVLGFSPAIGAFLTGLLIRGKQSKFLLSKIIPIKDLFIVLFFVSMGTLIQVSSLLQELVPIFVIAAGATAAKIVAGWFIVQVAGLKVSSREVGLTLTPIGEFSFVLAKEGAVLSSVKSTLVSMTGAIVILTVIISAIGLRGNSTQVANEQYKLSATTDVE